MIWLGAVIVIVHKQTNQQMSTFYDMKQSKIKATQQYIGQSGIHHFQRFTIATMPRLTVTEFLCHK
jgi:hypothetical protein